MIALKALEFTEVNKERNMKVNGRKTKGMDEEKWNEVRKNIILESIQRIGNMEKERLQKGGESMLGSGRKGNSMGQALCLMRMEVRERESGGKGKEFDGQRF